MGRYLVLVMRRAEVDVAIVPLHLAFLDTLRAQGHIDLAGPFADKSGGAYLLRAADLADAEATATSDPAHVSGGWDITVHEWLAH